MNVASYADALRYLYGFADYERNTPRQREFQHLEHVRALLRALGDPHRALRGIIHVGGTKGKGSTAAMLSAALRAAGHGVGTYSSPHLNSHRERYRLDGRPVEEARFTGLVRELAPTIDRVRAVRPLTTFEVSTALALELFRREAVDWAVVEVGLGGRLDTTNVLLPDLAVITSISLDHTEVLGDTLEAIAADKAGIIKPGVPVVVSPQRPEAMAPLRSRAREVGAPLREAAALARARDRRTCGALWQEWTLDTPLALGGEPLDGLRVRLGLLGAHQVENALAATVALATLPADRARVHPAHLVEGLARVDWPGRFEVVPGAPPIVLDGAHNPYSIRTLRECVAEVFGDREATWVFGAKRGHDAVEMLRELRDAPVVLCTSSHPRAYPAEELAALAAAEGMRVRIGGNVNDALALARRAADLVVVCGTLFAVADAREALGLAEATDPVRS